MYQNLTIILRQIHYSKISFAVLVPGRHSEPVKDFLKNLLPFQDPFYAFQDRLTSTQNAIN